MFLSCSSAIEGRVGIYLILPFKSSLYRFLLFLKAKMFCRRRSVISICVAVHLAESKNENTNDPE